MASEIEKFRRRRQRRSPFRRLATAKNLRGSDQWMKGLVRVHDVREFPREVTVVAAEGADPPVLVSVETYQSRQELMAAVKRLQKVVKDIPTRSWWRIELWVKE